MAKKAVRDAVVARLAANFSSATILNLNEDVLAPSPPWVRVEFPVANNSQAALNRRYREMGSFRVAVATAVRSGVSTSEDLCEAISTVFRNQLFSGVYCMVPTIREGVDDGSLFMASVIVPYRYEYND